MADEANVLIAGELQDGKLSHSTKELLAHGTLIAKKLGQGVAIALLSEDLGDTPQEAIAYGADKVYAVTDPLLQENSNDAYLAALEKVAKDNPPKALLFGKTELGREVGPRLAYRMDTVAAQDCVELRIVEKRLQAIRPVYGGNCLAAVSSNSPTMVAIVRGKTADPLERDDSRSGDTISISANLDSAVVRTTVLEKVEEASEGLRLEDARVVVSGGRGLGGPEPFFTEIQELADVLGAPVGASRAVVDAGWVPYSYQVGLTGKTISPEVYIAVGISGASQHMAGCSGSKVIVAINKDEGSNIFKEARYGVTGDWKKVLPAFTEQLKELL
jgi:electron transfer flavoprotein alpha subunit